MEGKPLYDFWVRLPKAFKDELEVGGTTIYLDPKWNEFEHRNLEAEVIAVPSKYDVPVEVGDTLYFHHHVVISGNGNGQKVQDDIYRVAFDPKNSRGTQVYAYKNKEGDIQLLSDWVFLVPEEIEPEITSDIIELLPEKKEYNQFGTVMWDSPAINEAGLKAGDRVFIAKNADYRMVVDGIELFRTHIDHIYAVL